MQTDLRSQFQSLQWQLEEQLPVGAPVDIIIGLPRELIAEELNDLTRALQQGSLEMLGKLQIGATPEWPNALRLKFRRPGRYLGGSQGTQLASLLTLVFGVLNVNDVLGWESIGG